MKKFLKRGWPRRFSLLVVLLVIYTLSGFAIIPLFIKSELEKQIDKSLNVRIIVEDINFNPFALSLTVTGLNAKDLSDRDLFSFSELYVNFQLRSIIERAYTFSLISLKGLELSAGIHEDGSFNFKDFLKISETKLPEEKKTAEMPNLIFDKIILHATNINYFDKTNNENFSIGLQPLEFSLIDFNTGSDKSAVVSLKTENGKTNIISYDGNFSLKPLKADGKISLSLQEPGPAVSYLLRSVNLSPPKAEINLISELVFSAENDQSEFLFNTSEFKIGKIELKDSSGNPLINLPALSAKLGFDLGKRQLMVQNLRADSAEIFLSINDQGSLNFAALSKSNHSSPQASEKAALKILVEDAKLEKFIINYQDRQKKLKFEDFSLNIESYDSADSGKIKAKLESIFAGGSVGASLEGNLNPIGFSSDLKLSKVNLSELSQWIEGLVNATQQAGSLEAECNLKAGHNYSLSGKILVNDYLLQGADKPVAGWKQLGLDSFNWDSASNLLTIKNLLLDRPALSIKIDKDSKFVVVEAKTNTSNSNKDERSNKSGTQTEKSDFRYQIQNIKLNQGQLDFKDESVKHGYHVSFSPLNAQIAGLESTYKKTIKLNLDSVINGQGKITYAGYLALGSPMLLQNGQLSVSDLDMLPLSPYSLKYIGRPINGGKINLDTKSETKGDDIFGENKVVLDRFYLGPETGGSIINLPISTALSIMRDGSEKITLNLPVRGNVKSAGMSYRNLLYKSFENLILEVVASPLTILGSLYNFSSEELSHIDFEPEESELNDQEKTKLDLILKAMADKKALKIEIRAVVAAGSDSSSKDWSEDLQELASQRVSAIRDYLTKDRILTSERIYIVTPDLIRDDKLEAVPSRLRITS